MEQFDYESKLWGANIVRKTPQYLGALRLKYLLEDIQSIHGKIIDLGCGGGGMTRAIQYYRSDLHVYGGDVSKSAIERAKQEKTPIDFVVANIYKLPFKDNSFECVCIFDLLEHLDEPEKAVKEIYRILKPGGIFYSYTPCEGEPSNYDFWFRKFGWKGKEMYAGHIQKFKARDLEKMMHSAGFTTQKKRWSNHFFNQFFDALHFLFLTIRGENLGYSLESYVNSGKKSLFKKATSQLVKLVAVLTYGESYFLSQVPGHGVHLTMKK